MLRHKNSKGFTIIETMIAMTVFGVVLLTVTGAILFMTRQYQHSQYVASTQASVTSIIQAVSQAAKYTSQASAVREVADVSNPTVQKCIGNREFLYTLGRKLTVPYVASPGGVNTNTQSAFIVRSSGACGGLSDITAAAHYVHPTDKELLSPGMRLADFDIKSMGGGFFEVHVRVLYGEDDLLCAEDITDSCSKGSPELDPRQILANRTLRCKDDAGREFCAMSELTTVVQPRLK